MKLWGRWCVKDAIPRRPVGSAPAQAGVSPAPQRLRLRAGGTRTGSQVQPGGGGGSKPGEGPVLRVSPAPSREGSGPPRPRRMAGPAPPRAADAARRGPPRAEERGGGQGAMAGVKEEAEEVKIRALVMVKEELELEEVKVRAVEWVGEGGKRRRVNLEREVVVANAGPSGRGAGRQQAGNA